MVLHRTPVENTSNLFQVPAITVVLAGYMGCNADAAIIMFAISIGFNGMTVPGSKSSMLDFSPKYSGKDHSKGNSLSIHQGISN